MSTLKTGALRGTSGTADSVQLHASNQSVTFPGAVTITGALTSSTTALGGALKQLVQTTKTSWDSNNTTEGGLWDVNALIKRDITTTSNSSKVLVIMNLSVGFEGDNGGDIGVQLTRQDGGSGNFDLISGANGPTDGNRTRCHTFAAIAKGGTWANGGATVCYLDTPGNAGTYSYSFKLCHSYGSTKWIYLNRSHDDTNASWTQRGITNIICAELQF